LFIEKRNTHFSNIEKKKKEKKEREIFFLSPFSFLLSSSLSKMGILAIKLTIDLPGGLKQKKQVEKKKRD